ncbi:MAG: IS256 family transposase [Candidatus Obscuribacterales bacterium]
MKTVLEALFNLVMRAERSQTSGASPYERSDERRGYANGYKAKTWHNRMGPLQLNMPKVRGIEFYPKSLERGCRSERALKAAVAEMYVQGVSTRKVKAITEELCGLEVSSSQVSRMTKELDVELERFRNRPLGEILYLLVDATYFKVRHNGAILDIACLIAYGIDREGKPQIVGVSTSLSEAEVHWRSFFTSLVDRGLRGLELIVSDDNPGMNKARMAVFPSVPWQRCQFHLSQNAQSYAPTKEMRGEIAKAMRQIFGSQSLEDARMQVKL